MRAALGEFQSALQMLARSVASDFAPRIIKELPPDVDVDRMWIALEESGLLHLRRDGGSILDLALCAEEFGAALSAVPFIGASLGRELRTSESERAVASIDGVVAIDAIGARSIVVIRDTYCVRFAVEARVPMADRSRVAHTVGLEIDSQRTSVDAARFDAIAKVLFGADLVGVGTAAVLEAVEHARSREQFGQPIGSFQAVQHLLVDAWVALQAARNALRSAAWRLDVTTSDALASAARAKMVADEAGIGACEAAIQVLGGIGHTWEHLASVRLRRALLSRTATPSAPAHLVKAPIATVPKGEMTTDGFDLRDDAIEAEFRARLDGFLASVPSHEDWHRTLAASGFVGVALPSDAGGAGLPVTCDAILAERLGDEGFPAPPAIAHLAHAVACFATPEQRVEHLAGLIAGTTRWCQGFSETNAGSDLAGLRTRAVASDNSFIVNGSKIWTSDAAASDMVLLLCRTGKDRHRGLSVLLVPLSTAGIEVRPIRTSWGSDEFAEITFTDVSVPRAALLGEEGQGWEIAMETLAVERGPADIGWIAKFRRDLGRLLCDPIASERPDVQQSAAWLEALDATVAVTLTQRREGNFVVATGSIDKLLMTQVDQMIHGAEIIAGGLGALKGETPVLERYLWGRAASIFGGSSQIQRTIVAERLLGLPRR